MSAFSVPYAPVIGSPEGLLQTLVHLAPEIAVMTAYAIKNGLRPSQGSDMVRLAKTIADPASLAIKKSEMPPPPEAPLPWGTLGEVEFELVAGPDKVSAKEGVSYVQHKVIGARPHVQFAAPGLRTVTLTLAWHSLLVADIKGKHGKLREAMEKRKVMRLVVGDNNEGTHLVGDYVITSMPYEIERLHGHGVVMSMGLTVELLEWNAGGPLEPGQHAPPAAVQGSGGQPTPAQSAGVNGDMTRAK